MSDGIDDWMVTVDEYDKILQSVYDRGFVLVDINQVWSESTDASGKTVMVRSELKVPEGKKPLILSFDDVNYYPYMAFLSQADPEVGATIQEEFDRECRNIELIASENIVSEAVMLAMGTVLTNKYAEGYPGKRYYGGCYAVDQTEELARSRACQLFGCKHANVQSHSGANANLSAFLALVKPGDTVMGMSLAHGGHLSHGSPVNISGKLFNIIPYGLNDETETIDYDKLFALAQEHRPKLIVAGASAYPRIIDFAKFREAADSVGAYLLVDMAHIAGLVAGGVHPSPFPYADVVTTTTHKPLRGPRGGMGDAMAKPASIISTPSCSNWRAISIFSFRFMLQPGDCSPSRKVVSNIFTQFILLSS